MEYKTVCEVSRETLDSLGEEEKINIDGYYYTAQEVKAIKRSIRKYIKGIPNIENDDPDREKKILSYLYVMMAYEVSYDTEYAHASSLMGYDRERYQDANNVDIRQMGEVSNSLVRSFY